MPPIGALHYVTTGEDGEFRVEHLRPGDYDVYAVPSHSASFMTRWTERVHLPKDKPFGRVTIRVGTTNSRGG